MITLDAADLSAHQVRLVDVLAAAFEDAPPLDQASGPALYEKLRAQLRAQGATDDDFELLTGQLARLVIESNNPFTPREKTTQLKLISATFALRAFRLEVDGGILVSLTFDDSPTLH